MKRILLFAVSTMLICSCYDEYVTDYTMNGVYVAYQYDLRSFVVGEDTELEFGVVFGGAIENTLERNVYFSLDDGLLTRDLGAYMGTESFTALDGLKGNAKSGDLSQAYVSDAVKNLTKLAPLPSDCFSLSNDSRIVIKKGEHTGVVSIKADYEKLLADPHFTHNPYYALAYRIVSADADTILFNKSYGIIALRAENMFFGDWYHGGKSVRTDASGSIIPGSESVYPIVKPADDNTYQKYTLTSLDGLRVETSLFHNSAGKMIIGMDGNYVTISDPDGRIIDNGCGWNEAKLLQDRQIYLNYSYANGDGTRTVVSDTLQFRARINDGVNEWQDTNPEHYK